MLGLDSIGSAAANLYDATVRGGLADLRRMPAEVIDRGPQRTVSRYLPVDDDAGAAQTRARAARPAAGGARDLLRPAPHLLAGRAHGARRALGLPARLRADRVRRPQPRPRALGPRRDPERAARGLLRRRRPAGADRRLVPGRDHVRARARRPRRAAGRLDRARRLAVGRGEGAARRPAAPDRRDDQGLGDHAALPPARRRARAAGQARLPARGLRQVRDEALDRAVEPRRPRPARPDRGGRRLHGLDARLPRPHLRPALPQLPAHERPRRRAHGAGRRRRRPGRRDGAAAGDRGARRRHRADRRLPSRRPTSPPAPPRCGSRPRPAVISAC